MAQKSTYFSQKSKGLFKAAREFLNEIRERQQAERMVQELLAKRQAERAKLVQELNYGGRTPLQQFDDSRTRLKYLADLNKGKYGVLGGDEK